MGKVQLALVAWRYRRELLMAAAVLVLLPFLLIGAVSGAFLYTVPLIQAKQNSECDRQLRRRTRRSSRLPRITYAGDTLPRCL